MLSDDEITETFQHKDFPAIYYDHDLKSLSKSFDELYNLFKVIKKRHDRKSTQRISKSVFDFVDRRDRLNQSPEMFYSCQYDCKRICILHVKDGFGIQFENWLPERDFLNTFYSSYRLNEYCVLGTFNDLDSAIDSYIVFVEQFCKSIIRPNCFW